MTNKWIPVNEKLPELSINNFLSEEVLVTNGCEIKIGWRQIKIGWRIYGYDSEDFKIIAWMPLPELYKAENEEDEK